MKNYFFLLLLFPLFWTACGNDDDTTVSENPLFEADLHYDEANFSAPILPGGTHIAAVRFTSNELTEFIGQNLTEVLFYLQEVPNSCIITVREQGTNSSPGAILYTAEISGFGPQGWNSHLLSIPVPITSDDLWVCVEVSHSGESRTIGCDPGPAEANADWLLSDFNSNSWETLRDFTAQEVNINWNIRARAN